MDLPSDARPISDEFIPKISKYRVSTITAIDRIDNHFNLEVLFNTLRLDDRLVKLEYDGRQRTREGISAARASSEPTSKKGNFSNQCTLFFVVGGQTFIVKVFNNGSLSLVGATELSAYREAISTLLDRLDPPGFMDFPCEPIGSESFGNQRKYAAFIKSNKDHIEACLSRYQSSDGSLRRFEPFCHAEFRDCRSELGGTEFRDCRSELGGAEFRESANGPKKADKAPTISPGILRLFRTVSAYFPDLSQLTDPDSPCSRFLATVLDGIGEGRGLVLPTHVGTIKYANCLREQMYKTDRKLNYLVDRSTVFRHFKEMVRTGGKSGAKGGEAELGQSGAKGGEAELGQSGAKGGEAELGQSDAKGGEAELGRYLACEFDPNRYSGVKIKYRFADRSCPGPHRITINTRGKYRSACKCQAVTAVIYRRGGVMITGAQSLPAIEDTENAICGELLANWKEFRTADVPVQRRGKALPQMVAFADGKIGVLKSSVLKHPRNFLILKRLNISLNELN
ncbi:MAG: hypothetical protein ACYCOU_01900 [Sulfobacillus sp.]